MILKSGKNSILIVTSTVVLALLLHGLVSNMGSSWFVVLVNGVNKIERNVIAPFTSTTNQEESILDNNPCSNSANTTVEVTIKIDFLPDFRII